MSFGSELRQERERQGVDLAAIAAGTKVSERYLRALEADAHGDLPGGIFNKGMVRSYCRHLGLNEAEWMDRFVASLNEPGGDPDWATFAENVKQNRPRSARTSLRWWGVLLMLLVLAAMAWTAWHFVIKRRVGVTQPDRPTVGSTAGQTAAG